MAKFLKWTVLVSVALLCLGPFLFMLSTSLEGGDVFKLETPLDLLPNEFTFAAYTQLYDKLELDLLRFFGNTGFLCFFGVFFELTLATMAAYPLARMEFKGKGLIMSALLATLMLPSQANIIVNFVTIRQLGLFNSLIAVLVPTAVTVFGIFLMRQAFLVIPKDLEDAARMDGAGHWFIFTKVMVPLARPALGTLALFSFVAHWNSFMWPLVILQDRAKYPLSVGLSTIQNTFDSNFRLVAAGSVLAMIPILILFLALQKQFIRGITAGAVK